MKELLLEIGTEEIPAAFIPQALNDLASIIQKEMETNRIETRGVKTFGTPRRLVLLIESVSEKQKDVELKRMGPPKQAAFDANGNPTPAAIGFAKSQSVPVESLQIVQTEKGGYVCAVRKETGKPALELLPSILPKAILSIPFQKSMRWAEISIRFARPIHWILALYGEEVIPFEVGNVQSGRVTYGHRFMHSGPIWVRDFHTYAEKLREGFVLFDPQERRKVIEKEMSREVSSVSGKLILDEDLLNEVSFLVEYPVVLRGTFDRKFLSLPQEILIHSMKEHQRYFPVVDNNGVILPYFICISNIDPKDRRVVIRGNEKVLRARLSDASYFFQEDLKIPLEKRVEQLKKVVFQAKLGTSYEKVERFRALALFISDQINPGLREAVDRVAFLCKADLVTGMVGEFPKLQGVVGREYARLSGEKPEVARAIHEHYLPAFAGDRLPSTSIGDIVSIADRLDTMVGCFGVGLVPTGTADPFGLRRHALAIIRIILEKKYALSLVTLIQESGKLLREKTERPLAEVQREVLDFFRVRYQNFLLDKGYPFDVLDAVFSISFDELLDVQSRIDTLREASDWGDFGSVVVGFKRAMNILKGSGSVKEVDVSLFREPAEEKLHGAFLKAKEKIEFYLSQRDYIKSIQEMVLLRRPIDEFFDQVMVMVDDEKIRGNRLGLLSEVSQLFFRMADFSKLT